MKKIVAVSPKLSAGPKLREILLTPQTLHARARLHTRDPSLLHAAASQTLESCAPARAQTPRRRQALHAAHLPDAPPTTLRVAQELGRRCRGARAPPTASVAARKAHPCASPLLYHDQISSAASCCGSGLPPSLAAAVWSRSRTATFAARRGLVAAVAEVVRCDLRSPSRTRSQLGPESHTAAPVPVTIVQGRATD
jgi:hypothetical protein